MDFILLPSTLVFKAGLLLCRKHSYFHYCLNFEYFFFPFLFPFFCFFFLQFFFTSFEFFSPALHFLPNQYYFRGRNGTIYTPENLSTIFVMKLIGSFHASKECILRVFKKTSSCPNSNVLTSISDYFH